MLIHDTHAHLDYYEKRLLEGGLEFNINEILKNHEFWIQPGVNIQRDSYVLENFLGEEKMFFMIGAHPGEVDENFDLNKYLDNQNNLLNKYKKEIGNKIIAIGEIGLDYRDGMPQEIKNQQKELFRTQIALAESLDLPFVIHCRDAFADVFEIIEKYKKSTLPFLIHCFTGTKEDYLKTVSLGGYVAFGGIVTYNNTAELNEALIDAENYVVETDLPWLAPTPYRGKLNHPEYIENIFEYIAIKKNNKTEDIIKKSRENTIKIFNLNLND